MATRPLCIISADWHAQPYAWRSHPQIAGDSYVAIEALADLCIELKPQWLFALGDLFDIQRPDPVTVKKVHEQLARIAAAGVKIGYIQGQHERHAEQPWLGLTDYAEHIHKKTIEIDDWEFYGLDWAPKDTLAVNLAEMPQVDFLLAHQVWQEQMDINHEASFTQIPGVMAVFTGDYHVHQQLDFENRDRDSAVAYSPGSLASQDVAEPWQKAVYVLESDNGVSHTRSVEIPSRAIFRYQLTTQGELEWFCGNVLHDVKVGNPYATHPVIGKPIVEVKFALSIPDALVQIQAACGDSVYLMLKPIGSVRETVISTSDEQRDTIREKGLLGGLDVLGLTADSPLYRSAYRLLQGGDPMTTLALMRDELLAGELDITEEDAAGNET